MRIWTLQRVSWTPDETYGVLLRDDGFPVALTLEDPWRFNQTARSCIPEGCFEAVPYTSPRYGKTWEIDVHQRSAILIHAGNSQGDTEGCILLGTEFGERTKLDILRSSKAIQRFKVEQPWQSFWLRVRNP